VFVIVKSFVMGVVEGERENEGGEGAVVGGGVTDGGGRMFVGLSLKLVGSAMMIVPRVPSKVGLGARVSLSFLVVYKR